MSKGKHKSKSKTTETSTVKNLGVGRAFTSYSPIEHLRMAYKRFDTALAHLNIASKQCGMDARHEALVDRLCDLMDDVAGLIAEMRREGNQADG